MKINVPGYRMLTIKNIILDFNGTITVDGTMKESVKQRIIRLAEQFFIYVITSDTQGTAARELEGFPITLKIFNNPNSGEYKRQIIEALGGGNCACIGNGHNDKLMFRAAGLSIAVLETEGLCASILTDADLLVKSSEDALDLLLDTKA